MHDISVISMIFTAILVLGCLFITISPLFRLDSYLKFNTEGEDLSTTKETLLTTLNEIEFDYKMDKISQVDYKNLKRQYESQIVSIMKEEEQHVTHQVDKDLMDEVEREIQAAMKNKKTKKGEEK